MYLIRAVVILVGVTVVTLAPYAAGASSVCPVCQKPLVRGREVFTRLFSEDGERRLTVRCVVCFINLVAKVRPKRAVARSRCRVSDRWVTISWNGNWALAPPSAVFLLAPERRGECLDRHLVFFSRRLGLNYLKNRPDLMSHRLMDPSEVFARLSPQGGLNVK